MNKKIDEEKIPEGIPVWDNDIYELRNPVPKWWLYAYFASILFSIIYWILYPAWPGINGYTKGILGWSSIKQFKNEMTISEKNKTGYFQSIGSMSLIDIKNSKEFRPFILSFGKYIFQTRCAKCHGKDGKGNLGFFPSLKDSEWIHGGSLENIFKTIKEGQRNKMPKHLKKLKKDEIINVAEYVYSLSNSDFDKKKAEAGMEIFESDDGDCYDCHGDNAEGDIEIGAPNLTDSVWLYGGTRKDINKTITYGRVGIMPSWEDKFSDSQIKIISVYVKLMNEMDTI